MRTLSLPVGSHLLRVVVLLLGIASLLDAQGEEPVDFVDVFVGTSNSRWMLGPYACVPFGMVQPGPDNQTGGWMSGYEYSIANVSGFSHLHAWTMGGLLIMPAAQDLALVDGAVDRPYRGANAGYHSRIRKETEEGAPGYYAVELYDAHTKAEITATTRCGFFRFTSLEDGDFRVLVDLAFPSEYRFSLADARITKVSDREIEGVAHSETWGFEYDLHFVVRFDRPFSSFNGWHGDEVRRDVSSVEGGEDAGAWVTFSGEAGAVLHVQTAVSLVDLEGARKNLAAELDPFAWDFDAAVRAARKQWNDLLGRIRVEGGTREDKVKFYTNLYRSYCAKQTWNDVDGRYRDPHEVVRQLPKGAAIYGGDAFWNTYWNLNPLWALITPHVLQNWVITQLELYEHTGWTSNGPTGVEMTGIMETSHEIALVVGAYQKGIRGYDAGKLYEAVRHTAMARGEALEGSKGRAGNQHLDVYDRLGYVPTDEGWVCFTQDYAFDDYCVAQFAAALGKEDDYSRLLARSRNWRNLFHPELKFIVPRDATGSWKADFDPFSGEHFMEGNSWQYTWYVPHDVPGLVEAMGRELFLQRLEEGFERAAPHHFAAHAFDRTEATRAEYYVNHGNQVNMQAAYLFNYAGAPWLTQKYARAIMDAYYGATPYHGWEGDEDEGQMGAWFVMSALGLFEMDGGVTANPTFDLGSPLFARAVITLDPAFYPGGTLVITAANNAKDHPYVQEARWNGLPLAAPRLPFAAVAKGGRLELVMGPEPNEDLW